MRILLVSQMYPGPSAPDLGVFVRDLERALEERGHDIERAVIDSRVGGKRRYVELARNARAAAKRLQPDVCYAHFLVPAGAIAAHTSQTPLVVTAHGQDVANVGTVRGIQTITARVCRRAAAVIAVSDYLRCELEARVVEARGKVEVVDCGVDLGRFAVAPAPAEKWSFVCVGTLTERKNCLRLADAFASLGEPRATLTFVGDGALRPRLEGRAGVALAGSVAHGDVAAHIAAAQVVCQPSLVEPFGQALLEAMAMGRPVVATRVGGPPELVPDGAGVLVDPLDVASIADGLRRAVELPCPNAAARAAAEGHDVRLQAERVEAILERAAASA